MDQTKEAARLLKQAKHAVALTGAGISTPSGIPDFRSRDGGLWQNFNPMEVASLSIFRIQPKKFFDWFRPMTEVIFDAQPNPAHIALADLEKNGHIKAVITQNIDTLHQRAGSQNVLEVHGTLESLTCVSCFTQYSSDQFIQAYVHQNIIPECKQCGSILKPDVILYEEQLPAEIWLAAVQEIEKCDLILVAGSSLEVVPVAGLPVKALNNGAKLILINNTPTYVDSRAEITIYQDVIDALPTIADELI